MRLVTSPFLIYSVLKYHLVDKHAQIIKYSLINSHKEKKPCNQHPD